MKPVNGMMVAPVIKEMKFKFLLGHIMSDIDCRQQC